MELSADRIKELKDWNNSVLNIDPPYVETKEGENGTYKHIPIGHLQADLETVFHGLIKTELLSVQPLFNAVNVNVRLHYFHPIIFQWMFQDGTACVPIEQLTAGKYSDTVKVLKVNAEQLVTPFAMAEAEKNAARKIGKRFGRDQNRDLTIKKPDAVEAGVFDLSTIKNERDLLKAIALGVVDSEQAKLIRESFTSAKDALPYSESDAGHIILVNEETAHQIAEDMSETVPAKVGARKSLKSKVKTA